MRRTKSIWLALLGAAFAFSMPLTAEARRDHHDRHWRGDGDRWRHYDYDRRWYGGYSRRYYYGRPYYYNYGYRPYYYRPAPIFSFGFYRSRPATTYYSTRVVDDVALDVQRALARKGYYRGPIDGDVGPMTRAAIRSYQVDRGLPLTGRIDGPLVRSLGV